MEDAAVELGTLAADSGILLANFPSTSLAEGPKAAHMNPPGHLARTKRT